MDQPAALQPDTVPVSGPIPSGEPVPVSPPPPRTRRPLYKTVLPVLVAVGVILLAIGVTIAKSGSRRTDRSLVIPSPATAPTSVAIPASPAATRPAGRKTFTATGIAIDVPAGWTVSEDVSGPEKTVSLTRNGFRLTVVHDPVFTGGGAGFMYDGIDMATQTQVSAIFVGTAKASKITRTVAESVYREKIGPVASGSGTVFGGSVLTTKQGSVTFPATVDIRKSDGSPARFLIKYSYDGAIGTKSSAYTSAMTDLDTAVASITVN